MLAKDLDECFRIIEKGLTVIETAAGNGGIKDVNHVEVEKWRDKELREKLERLKPACSTSSSV